MSDLLLLERGERTTAHDAFVLDSPERLAAASHPVGWRILVELARRPDYPSALARRLRLHEQKVYYHVKRLRKAGLLRVAREERRKGATTNIMAPSAEAFAFVLPGTGSDATRAPPLPSRMRAFLSEFGTGGVLDTRLVLGSPTPHGPFLTAARDSPYAAHLGLFLGRHFAVRPGLSVRLDTEVKAGGLERENLVLVGGPVANIVTLDLNPHLRVRFDWREVWRLESPGGTRYADESVGLVAKVRNPWRDGAWILLLAGLHYQGTIASLLALTEDTGALLEGYEGGEHYRVVQGLDRDGDGRADEVAILE